MDDNCDTAHLTEKCMEREKHNEGQPKQEMPANCASQIEYMMKHIEQKCGRIDEEKKHCAEKSAKRCGQVKGLGDKCKELLTEQNLRNFITEEAKKRCRFSDIVHDEHDINKSEKAEIMLAVLNSATSDDIQKLSLFVDDMKEQLKLEDTTIYKGIINPRSFGDVKKFPFVVNAKISSLHSSEKSEEAREKVLARHKAGEAAGKLASLRDSDLPQEYVYLIEDKASDVLNVSDSLDEVEKKEGEKGVGYKIKLFFGLAKRQSRKRYTSLMAAGQSCKAR